MAGPFEIHPNLKRTTRISEFTNDEGVHAEVEGLPLHESDNDVFPPTVSPDGMMYSVVNTRTDTDGAPINVRVRTKADANRDPNVQAFIEDFVDYTMLAPVGPVATRMNFVVGEEEPQ